MIKQLIISLSSVVFASYYPIHRSYISYFVLYLGYCVISNEALVRKGVNKIIRLVTLSLIITFWPIISTFFEDYRWIINSINILTALMVSFRLFPYDIIFHLIGKINKKDLYYFIGDLLDFKYTTIEDIVNSIARNNSNYQKVPMELVPQVNCILTVFCMTSQIRGGRNDPNEVELYLDDEVISKMLDCFIMNPVDTRPSCSRIADTHLSNINLEYYDYRNMFRLFKICKLNENNEYKYIYLRFLWGKKIYTGYTVYQRIIKFYEVYPTSCSIAHFLNQINSLENSHQMAEWTYLKIQQHYNGLKTKYGCDGNNLPQFQNWYDLRINYKVD